MILSFAFRSFTKSIRHKNTHHNIILACFRQMWWTWPLRYIIYYIKPYDWNLQRFITIPQLHIVSTLFEKMKSIFASFNHNGRSLVRDKRIRKKSCDTDTLTYWKTEMILAFHNHWFFSPQKFLFYTKKTGEVIVYK